jgi:Ca2+-binding EF-hand superfamily protein
VNYLRIFKNLDSDERGIITGEQLECFYKEMGGISVSINFGVLIEAFSQPGQNWLTYSEFCEIFKPSIERS